MTPAVLMAAARANEPASGDSACSTAVVPEGAEYQTSLSRLADDDACRVDAEGGRVAAAEIAEILGRQARALPERARAARREGKPTTTPPSLMPWPSPTWRRAGAARRPSPPLIAL